LDKKTLENCEFLKAKAGYDVIVSEQRKQNKGFHEIITKTNEAIAELSESVKLTITEIQEQIVSANSKGVANDEKLAGIHESIRMLKMCSEDNKREIKELREHLDNGYQKKLRDAIEETQKKNYDAEQQGTDGSDDGDASARGYWTDRSASDERKEVLAGLDTDNGCGRVDLHDNPTGYASDE